MDKKKVAKKTYAGEIYARVNEVSELILRGLYRKDILHYGAKWGVSNRTIDKYIGMANSLLKKQALKDFDINFSKVQRRYDSLYYKALQNEDLGLAASITEKYSKLTGVNEPEKFDHTSKGEKISTTKEMTTEELLLRAEAVKIIESPNWNTTRVN